MYKIKSRNREAKFKISNARFYDCKINILSDSRNIMRRTSFFFLLVASVFLHVQGKTTEYTQSKLYPVSDDSISIEYKARFKEEKVVSFQPTKPHDHCRNRTPQENRTVFHQRQPTCSAKRDSVHTKQEAPSHRDANRSQRERVRRITEQLSARNTHAESNRRQTLNDRRRLSIDSRGRRGDKQGQTSSVNQRLRERKDSQNSERRADLRTTASSAEPQRRRSSINYHREHGQRDSDIRNRRNSSDRRNRRGSSERLMRFTSELRNTRDSSERRNTRHLSEQQCTRDTSKRRNTGDTSEPRNTGDKSERRNMRDTRERRNMRVSTERHNTRDLNERRNTRDTSKRRNTRDLSERRNTRDLNERRNTIDLNERRNTKDTSERRNTRDLNERRNTRDLNERQNTKDTSEQRSSRDLSGLRNTRDTSERRITRDISERRNMRDLSERRTLSTSRERQNTRDTGERQHTRYLNEQRNTRDTIERRLIDGSSVEITDARRSIARKVHLDYAQTDAVRRSHDHRRMMRRSQESELLSRTRDEHIRIGESRLVKGSDNFRMSRSRNNVETPRQLEFGRVGVRENNKYARVDADQYTNGEKGSFEKEQRAISEHARQGENRQRQSQRRDEARRGNTVGILTKAERTVYDGYRGLDQRLEKRWSRRKDLTRDYEVNSFVYLLNQTHNATCKWLDFLHEFMV